MGKQSKSFPQSFQEEVCQGMIGRSSVIIVSRCIGMFVLYEAVTGARGQS